MGGNPGPGVDAPSGFGYRPGLDGLRAVALLAVMTFHNGYRDARGGYLGVSAFFTLSGFLITTLALDEHRRTGGLSWGRFWERRARRLLPAALVTLVAVLVLQARWGIGAGPGFRRDLVAAVAYVTNWRLAASGQGYAGMFAAPSPLTHLWSLAIEEQFYLLFPLAFAGLMVAVGARRRRATAVVALAAVASFALAWWSAGRYGNDGLTYYGTHTRAGELLVGVALAFVLSSARGRRPLAAPAGRWLLTAAGLAALAGLAWLWHETAIGDPRLFRGVTALNAGLTALVIVAVLAGPLDRLLGVAPLRGVGKISYAAYLFHWPLFLLIAAPRVHRPRHELFAVRVTVTLALATASYFLIEAPFRFRLRMPRLGLAAVLATGATLVVALAVVVPAGQPAFADLGRVQVAAATGGFRPARDVTMVGAVRPAGGRPVATVFLAGDSVAYSMMPGFLWWNDHEPGRQIQIDSHIAFGCPLGGQDLVQDVTEHWVMDDCRAWRPDLPGALATSKPDAIVMVMGLEDLNGHKVGGQWRTFGDRGYERWLRHRIAELATMLTRPGVPVLWLTFPHVRSHDPADPTRPWQDLPINDPAKVDRLNALIRQVAAHHPGITVVDLAGWLQTWPGQSFRPDDRDGVHFSFAAADRVDTWLIPQVLAALPAH